MRKYDLKQLMKQHNIPILYKQKKSSYKYKNKIVPINELDIINGDGLSSLETKKLLKASYEPDKLNLEDWLLDSELSDNINNVFINNKTGQVVFTIAGTQGFTDWTNNLTYAVAGNKGYKNTKRYKTAEKVFNKAKKKYGNNIILLGHSQGALSASLLANDDDEVITYNRATSLGVKNVNKNNQTNLSVKGDLVSELNSSGLDYKKIKTKFINPLKNHSINRLSKN